MKRMNRFKLNNFKLDNLKLDNLKLDNLKLDSRGITLQTVIITAILALAAAGAGVIIYNIVSDEAEDIEEVSSSLDDFLTSAAAEIGDASSSSSTSSSTSSTTSTTLSSDTTTTTTTTENTGQTDSEIPLPPEGFMPPTGFLYPGGFVEPVSASKISASYHHSCAILESKQIRCWGYNGYGQLGDATRGVNRDIPVAVKGISGADEVSAGLEFSCALLEDGTIRCWGRNQFGQLGDGTTNNRQSPVQVLGIDGTTPATTATRMAVGLGHACALLGDNSVQCWGNGAGGQLGNGERNHQSTPVLVMGISAPNGAIQVSAGNISTCALLVDNTVQCWGDNRFGQLGNDSIANTSSVPVTVTGIDGTTPTMSATQISVGGTALVGHACALLEDGTVKCWGSNNYGQLGDGSTTNSRVPVAVTGIVDAVNVSAGRLHTCAVLASGEIRCWGFNSSGQLGDNTFVDKLVPTRVANISNGSKVFSGENHTCALLTTGFIRCWGSNSAGELGIGFTRPATEIISVRVAATVTQVSTGFYHTCVLMENGAVQCWGNNSWGRLGDGTENSRSAAAGVMEIDGTTPEKSATQISAGVETTCALLEDQSIKCWGRNEFGQLGVVTGDPVISLTPVTVDGISGTAGERATQVAVGQWHACALLEDETVSCWGDDSRGQLGNESVPRDPGLSRTPVAVSGITTATQISVGVFHSCALLQDKTIQCWGRNVRGRIGNGGRIFNSIFRSPVTVVTITNAIQVSAGYFNTCALLEDKTVSCWGNNQDGQLGDGTVAGSSTPIPVVGLNNVVQVSAGLYYMCALLENNRVRCWGNNEAGQLGDGTLNDRTRPTRDSEAFPATQVSVSKYQHTCALLVDKTIQCWGSDSQGQLGALTDMPIPARIIILS